MVALIVGVLLLVAKLAELGPVGEWSWWIVLAPFAVAAAWWQFSDSSGLTKRREIDKLERRKQERREKAMEALGLDSHRERQVRKARAAAAQRNATTAARNDAKAEESIGPR